MTAHRGRVLIVAGSDSGGGAGIQADIKTVTALGGYAMTAVSALTVQNTRGVTGVHEVPATFVAAQMRSVLTDIGCDAVKTGMLASTAVILAAVAELDAHAARAPLVVDPVMVAKGGARLIAEEALQALKAELVRRAAVITPNIPEAEALTGLRIRDVTGMRHAAEMLMTLGCKAVLVKGGHLPGPEVHDVLYTEREVDQFSDPRIDTRHTHGTGCTLASAIATGLASGVPLREAVAQARAYVREAIRTAPGFGHGHGPLNHGHTVRRTF